MLYYGGLAQMAERSLSVREVLGSTPRFSIIKIDFKKYIIFI